MTSKQNVNVAEAVRLINQAIGLCDKKRKLLIELRDKIITEHATDDFPRPMGVRRCGARFGSVRCNAPSGHEGAHTYA